MKYEIKYTDYDKDTKISTAIIETDLGTIKKTAKLNKEDLKYESTYFGCEVAIARCIQEYYKRKTKIIRLKIEELENSYKNIRYLIKTEKNRLNHYKNYITKIDENININCDKRIKRIDKMCSKK